MTTDSTPLLTARDLTVVLDVDGEPTRVLDDVSLEVAHGLIVDVVGPSGSGKTTLLRALARLLPGATGDLSLGDKPASSMSPQRWRALVALLPQKPAIVPGSVRHNLLVPWTLRVRRDSAMALPADDALRARLDSLGMSAVALERDAARLSVGQQARLAFARTLLTGPSVLLLDEADASLDDDSAALLGEAVSAFAAQGSSAVVRVRHRADDGRASLRLRLEHGHLAEAVVTT